jgi:hypothetical protein
MLHLLIFIMLTFLLILFPIVSKPKNKGSNLLSSFQLPKKSSFLNYHNLFSNLTFLMNLFEYMFENNFSVHFLWTSGFIAWILGCCLWVLQIEFLSLILIFISIICCLTTIYGISDLNLSEISILRTEKLGFAPYILIVSISVLTLISFNSIAIGLTTVTLLMLFWHNWKILKKYKKKQASISIEDNTKYRDYINESLP